MIYSALAFMFFAIAFLGIMKMADNYQWSKRPTFIIAGKLLNIQHRSSTLETHSVPVVTTNGFGVGMVTTGEDGEFVTIWDCGKYGRLVADDEEVFRWAQPKSNLIVKEKDNEVRIYGIQR